jgi:protein SCO1/2
MMNKPAQKIEWLVWGGLAVVIAVIGGAFIISKMPRGKPLPVIGQISDFNLTNQMGAPVSLADLKGKVWVADIIFTRCAGPCPIMTHHLAELQAALPPNKPIRLVTFTSDPDFDTSAVMRNYAAKFGANSNVWWFLTGPKPELRKLAINDFKFVVVEIPAADQKTLDDLFIHSTWYVLVDQQGRTRGWTDDDGHLHAYFDSADPAAVAKIIPAINQLLRGPAL